MEDTTITVGLFKWSLPHTHTHARTHLQQRRLHQHPVPLPRVDEHAADRHLLSLLVRRHAAPQRPRPVVEAEGPLLNAQKQNGPVELLVGLGGDLRVVWRLGFGDRSEGGKDRET